MTKGHDAEIAVLAAKKKPAADAVPAGRLPLLERLLTAARDLARELQAPSASLPVASAMMIEVELETADLLAGLNKDLRPGASGKIRHSDDKK